MYFDEEGLDLSLYKVIITTKKKNFDFYVQDLRLNNY